MTYLKTTTRHDGDAPRLIHQNLDWRVQVHTGALQATQYSSTGETEATTYPRASDSCDGPTNTTWNPEPFEPPLQSNGHSEPTHDTKLKDLIEITIDPKGITIASLHGSRAPCNLSGLCK